MVDPHYMVEKVEFEPGNFCLRSALAEPYTIFEIFIDHVDHDLPESASKIYR